MLESTHIFQAKEGNTNLAVINCDRCTNTFYVPIIGENEPNFCAYCGIKFRFYIKDDKGQIYNLAGIPINKTNNNV